MSAEEQVSISLETIAFPESAGHWRFLWGTTGTDAETVVHPKQSIQKWFEVQQTLIKFTPSFRVRREFSELKTEEQLKTDVAD